MKVSLCHYHFSQRFLKLLYCSFYKAHFGPWIKTKKQNHLEIEILMTLKMLVGFF